jgi:hypothetical protein
MVAFDPSIWKQPPKADTNSLDRNIPQVLGTSIMITLIKKDMLVKESRPTLRSYIRPHTIIGVDSDSHIFWYGREMSRPSCYMIAEGIILVEAPESNTQL